MTKEDLRLNLKRNAMGIISEKVVYRVNLLENDLPSKRSEINNSLMGKEVIIDSKLYKVIGIDMFATPEEFDHKDVCLMVEPI